MHARETAGRRESRKAYHSASSHAMKIEQWGSKKEAGGGGSSGHMPTTQ